MEVYGDERMAMTDETIESRVERLLEILRGYGRVAVAFSGGVDSAVVAKAAQLALGDGAMAITGVSPSLAESERQIAVAVARQVGIRHELVTTHEFDDPRYRANDGTRCYYCKSELYDRVDRLREEWGFDVILSGANLDDLGDYRPGLRAAAERFVRHPLQEAGFTKAMVREAARNWGLPVSEKPASPCLSSRIAIGLEATPERVRRVELAERLLRDEGFSEFRVRYHADDHARLEVPIEEAHRLLETERRTRVVAGLREVGFAFVSLDLEGFRSGALNRLVPVELLTQ